MPVAVPHNRVPELEPKQVAVSLAFAILPALVLFILILYIWESAPAILFWIALIVFTYLLYGKRSIRERASGMLFWLAMEAFLAPLAFAVHLLTLVMEEGQTIFDEIVVLLLIVAAAVIFLLIGGVLLLVSRRLEPDESAGDIEPS